MNAHQRRIKRRELRQFKASLDAMWRRAGPVIVPAGAGASRDYDVRIVSDGPRVYVMRSVAAIP